MTNILTWFLCIVMAAAFLYVLLIPAQWIGYYEPPYVRSCVDYIGRPICNIPPPTYDWGYWHADEYGYVPATMTQMLDGEFIHAIPEGE